MEQLLYVKNLYVSFKTYAGEVQAVRGVSFALAAGEAIAIVGESGCGKTAAAQSVMKLIPTPPGRYISGQILFSGKDLLPMSEKEMRQIRGRHIGIIFQDPMTSLNPTMKVGNQITDVLKRHCGLTAAGQKEKAIEMLSLVGLSNPAKRFSQYPHEFSGGMRQRAMIAAALACSPRLLIADEPTTSLDVTIQAQIMELLRGLKEKLNMSVILITHNLGVVAGFADRVVVMYAGSVVESGPTREIYYHPQHPYTRGLLASMPQPGQGLKRKLYAIAGRPPDLQNLPQSCAFWPRCNQAMRICRELQPPVTSVNASHHVSCWLYRQQFSRTGINK